MVDRELLFLFFDVHPFLLCNFAGCTKDISRVTHFLPGEEPIGYSAQPLIHEVWRGVWIIVKGVW